MFPPNGRPGSILTLPKCPTRTKGVHNSARFALKASKMSSIDQFAAAPAAKPVKPITCPAPSRGLDLRLVCGVSESLVLAILEECDLFKRLFKLGFSPAHC